MFQRRNLGRFRRSATERRTGAATVEFAVCLPLLMLIGFASIETANAMFLKQVLAQSAYEGARVGAQPDADTSKISTRCNDILQARGIKTATVSVTPSNCSDQTAKGTAISVSVSAPATANAIFPLTFFKNSTITKKVVLTRL